MSASREKKQRQDDPTRGSPRSRSKERKEAAIKKRNTGIYTVIGVVVGRPGWWPCWFGIPASSRAVPVAMTINGRDYSPAEVSHYYGQTKQSYGYICP